MPKIHKEKINWKSVGKGLGLTGLFLTTFGILGSGAYVYSKLQNLPDINTQYLNTYGNTEILDAKGNVIWKSTEQRTKTTTFAELEPTLIDDALIATEDQDFYANKGFSYKGLANMIIGVIYSKINSSYVPRGGSTIDQQLIKNTYFDGGVGHETSTRKIQELFLAKQLDENYNKQEILEMYVNSLTYAEGDTGLAAIAMTYFGKNISDFTERTPENIAQTAYLAGLAQAPSTYNLYENVEAATERKNIVLGILLEQKVITEDEYNSALTFDLASTLKPRFWEAESQRAQNLKYKVYTDMVLSEVAQKGYNVDDLSMKIHTFLDPDTFDAITNKVREDRYYQDGAGGSEQVAATVMNKDGIVIGMVGSRYENDELNRAVQQSRSSGSSMKPFTSYGPLFQYMGYSYNTASLFSTAPYLYPGTNFYMQNYGGATYGTRDAQYSLRMSLNTPVARIADEILGSTRIKTYLNGLGLDIQQSYSSQDAIGLNISSLQAAAAYNALNNNGTYIEPRFVDKIEFTDKSTKTFEPITKQAMNPSTAFVLTQMLRGTVTEGYSAKDAAIPSYQGYAGKTGSVALDPTSGAYNLYGPGGSDIWYDSITNDGYSISVWFGYDKPNESPQLADSFEGHQWLGRDLQLMLNGNRPVENWKQPDDVSLISGSGLNAHYAITDSKDIDNIETAQSVPAISDYYQTLEGLSELKAEESINKNWNKSLRGREKLWYNLWDKNNSILNQDTLIENDLYNTLKD